MFFNVESHIQIYNGQMAGRIIENADNAYFVLDRVFFLKLDNKEKEKFSRILLNNLLVAYERSKLGAFLAAPLENNDIEKWKRYGNVLHHLYELLVMNEDLKFFKDEDDVEDFARNMGKINPRNLGGENFFETIEQITAQVEKVDEDQDPQKWQTDKLDQKAWTDAMKEVHRRP